MSVGWARFWRRFAIWAAAFVTMVVLADNTIDAVIVAVVFLILVNTPLKSPAELEPRGQR